MPGAGRHKPEQRPGAQHPGPGPAHAEEGTGGVEHLEKACPCSRLCRAAPAIVAVHMAKKDAKGARDGYSADRRGAGRIRSLWPAGRVYEADKDTANARRA